MQKTVHSTLFGKIKAKAYISRQKERMCTVERHSDNHSSIRRSQILSKSILPLWMQLKTLVTSGFSLILGFSAHMVNQQGNLARWRKFRAKLSPSWKPAWAHRKLRCYHDVGEQTFWPPVIECWQMTSRHLSGGSHGKSIVGRKKKKIAWPRLLRWIWDQEMSVEAKRKHCLGWA